MSIVPVSSEAWPSDDWVASAACAQTDPKVFFPDKGGSAAQAKRICQRCPVREQCLWDALDSNDVDFGIRAGYSPRQRKLLVKVSESRGAA